MKKPLTLALALVLVLSLCACNRTSPEPVVTEFTFPEGTSLLGVDLAGLTPEGGWTNVQNAVNGHVLNITVDGVEASITGEEIGLVCSQERYDAIAAALEAGVQDIDMTGLVSFNEGKLRAAVNRLFNKPVTEASISFDQETGAYILNPDAVGQSCNPNELVSALKESVLNLEAAPVLTGVSQLTEPTIRDEDEAVAVALEAVNKMANVELTYNFTVDGKTSTLTIPRDTILSLISLGVDNVTPGINRSEMESFVAELSETYSSGNTTGPFQTTGGGTIGLTVTYNGNYLNQEEMAEDLSTCIMEGISGQREAPFQISGIRSMPYGGTYIEVNLSSQHLWFYKNGECILSTSLVSGKVSSGHNTPTGIFSIYGKSTNTYLVGEDYRSFVNYWMPFYGGYGLHDATWRGSFGGDIYLYGGSHGCVNLPLSSAATIFNNAPVGTKVILYGGTSSVPPQPQSLSGTTHYSVAEDAGTITLDIKPRYSGPTMSYSSSNSSVATVSSGGVVTIKGIGTATITVSVPAKGGYSSATTSVTISVHSTCDEGRHNLGQPTTIKPATCQPGKESVSCTKCSYTTERETPAVESHSYGTWTQTVPPTCGAKGLEERVCSKCEIAKETRDVDNSTIAHTEDSGAVTTAPGCTTEGVKTYGCVVCGKALRTEPIAATGHSHSWQVTTPPTCTAEGVESYKCACGDVAETRPVPATGHSYSTQTTSPSCTSDGVEKSVCGNCGDVASSTVLPATGHSYSNGTCSKCGAADPDYVAPTPSGEETP